MNRLAIIIAEMQTGEKFASGVGYIFNINDDTIILIEPQRFKDGRWVKMNQRFLKIELARLRRSEGYFEIWGGSLA